MYPVHLASLQGYLDCVNKLLSNMEGVQIDAPDDFNRTCLHAAACGGKTRPVGQIDLTCVKLTLG